MLRIGLLECEDLGVYLSPPLFARFGGIAPTPRPPPPTTHTHHRASSSHALADSAGYYRMACDVFDYVSGMPASELSRHGVAAPLLTGGSVRVEFERFNAQAGQLPLASDLQRYDGFIITGSLAGVYDDEPWIRALERWTADAHRARCKVTSRVCFSPQFLPRCSVLVS